MWRKLLLAALGFAASIVLAEIILRLLPVATGYSYQPLNERNPILHGEPNAPYVYSLGWNFRRVNRGTLNNEGFIADRQYDLDTKGGVLVVGDSYVLAAAMPDNENLHAKIAKALPSVGVVGLSRAGGALPDYLEMIRWGINRYRSGAVVVLAVSDDVMDSLTPRAGGYFFSRTEHGFEQVRVDRAPLSRPLLVLNESRLFRYLYDNLAFTVNLQRRLSPPAMSGKSDARQLKLYKEISNSFLDKLDAIVPKQQVIFVIHRTRRNRRFDYETDVNVLQEVVQERGYRVVDLGPRFMEYEKHNRQRLDSFPVDVHWNGLAQEYVAGVLVPQLQVILGAQESK
jgi:hypothetical protein